MLILTFFVVVALLLSGNKYCVINQTVIHFSVYTLTQHSKRAKRDCDIRYDSLVFRTVVYADTITGTRTYVNVSYS